MNEDFTKLNLDMMKKKASENLKPAVDNVQESQNEKFHSDLGNFDFRQDSLIRFGRKKILVFLNVLLVVSMFISWYVILGRLSGDITYNFGTEQISMNWVKIFVPLDFVFVAFVPVGVTLLVIGSRAVNIKQILLGLKLIRITIVIGFVGLVFLLISFSLLVLASLLGSVLLFLITIVILGLISYLLFSFLKHAYQFICDAINSFEHGNSFYDKYMPNPKGVRTPLIIFLWVRIIAGIVSIAAPNALAPANENLTGFTSAPIPIQITQIVLSVLIIFISLQMIDAYLNHVKKTTNEKTQKTTSKVVKAPYRYEGYEDFE